MADWRDDEGLSLLHKAAFNRDPKALRRLLSQGAVNPNFSPNLRDGKFGRTPLQVAEMACLKGPRASVTAARLSAAFESDSEEDYYSD